MNTPPKLRRHDVNVQDLMNGRPDGSAFGNIGNDEIAAQVGRVTAAFVHLEGLMAYLLAPLAGTDPNTAGYMLRAIKSPRGRVDLMRELLTKSPRNKDKGPEWDAVIAEFWRINLRRNAYVHGHWWTAEADGSVWLAEEDEHGLSFLTSRCVARDEMPKLFDQIGECGSRVFRLIQKSEAQPEEHPRPPDAPS